MVDKPKKNGNKRPDGGDNPPDESGLELSFEDSGVSERPTVAPPFDLESYAKETGIPSSDVVRSATRVGLPAPPSDKSLDERIDEMLNAVLSDEPPPPADDTVRAPSDTAITRPPPPLSPEPEASPPTAPKSAPLSAPMSQRQTPISIDRIEEARTRTVDGGPARRVSRPQNLLSLANMMAPSLPPVPPGVRTDPGPDALAPPPQGADVKISSSGDPYTEMRERFALGDYSGALVIAESMLEENPSHPEAREYADSCRSVLQQMYTARIGPLDRIPVVEVARDQMRWLSIDHRAGFVLSLVDGVSSLEMILDVSGMPTLDALRILYELVQQRIISFR